MALDLHITIPDDSPAARAVHRVILAESVTPEQAVTHILEDSDSQLVKTPAEEMWGALSSGDEVAMLDDIVREAYALRMASQPRDFAR